MKLEAGGANPRFLGLGSVDVGFDPLVFGETAHVKTVGALRTFINAFFLVLETPHACSNHISLPLSMGFLSHSSKIYEKLSDINFSRSFEAIPYHYVNHFKFCKENPLFLKIFIFSVYNHFKPFFRCEYKQDSNSRLAALLF